MKISAKKTFSAIVSFFIVCWVSIPAQANQPEVKSEVFSPNKSSATTVITEEAVWNQLKNLKDGILGTPLSVVDMGLIYSIQVENNNVHVVVTTTHPGYSQYMYVASPVRQKILAMPGVGTVTVEFVSEPAWTPDRMSSLTRSVLRFQPEDPVEGMQHVRSTLKADINSMPYDQRKLDRSHLTIPASTWGLVDTLSTGSWVNWRGWAYFKRFEVEEQYSIDRQGEPIQVDVTFDGTQMNDLAKEIRVVEESTKEEIPSQIYGEMEQGSSKTCTVIFMADIPAREKKAYYILYGNSSPDLQAPSYSTDLVTSGEGYALEIENSFYKVVLSKVMGQLKSVQFKNGGKTAIVATEEYPPATPPSTIVDASNDPGITSQDIIGHGEGSGIDILWHGEDSCIHWGPDFKDQLRFRITMWSEPPHYTVVKGPICTIVKRWGYPVTPIYPALPQSDVTIEATYVFYSGLPYFTMESHVNVEKEVDINVVRNDEWVFLLPTFTDMISMMDGGAIEVFKTQRSFSQNNPALWGFFNSVSGDGFASLHLAYDALGFPGAYRPNSSNFITLYYQVTMQLWVRYPYNGGSSWAIQPGATIGEYNAYLLYNAKDTGGHNQAKDWYNRLRQPLKASLPDYTTSVEEQENDSSTAPLSYSLSQNYPNPFNSSTEINYTLPEQGDVELSIYNLMGQKVATLALGNYGAGVHTVRWNGCDDRGRELASGVFLYQMRTGKQLITKKLLLLR